VNKQILGLIRREYEKGMDKSRNYKGIRKFFDMTEKGEYTLDDQTWEDLNMDKVYGKLDRNYSSLGESSLYSMLRNPLMDEEKLKERNKLIDSLKNNQSLREKLQYIFFDLGKNTKNSFLYMMENELEINKLKYYLYTFIGKILPCIIILLAIFIDIKINIGLIVLSGLNMIICNHEQNKIKSNGILYLRNILKASKKISNIKNQDIAYYTDKIKSILKKINNIDRNMKLIGIVNMWGGMFEFISLLFLLEESAYYAVSGKLKEKKQYVMELYYIVGELEALISIAGYQNNLKVKYIKPELKKETSLTITEGVHPLIEDAVPNSIKINNKGIVLTGTNMSGKSTFLKMLGVNIILAQTFYFVLAEEYKASFFNVVTSISPKDDLTKGKSYYMAEAESILRIFDALKKDIPVFCSIDEIFRGTNPIERIALSGEILTYLNNENTISIVTTHDRELANILKNDYEFYYFSENVNSTDGLSFDYKLKKGISQTRNAIKLLEYMNYPKKIIQKAYKRAESIKGFI
jgi:DNA mismatch repair ATPase MutS